MSQRLKQFLFDQYGGFADKTLKRIERNAPFQIDDLNEFDEYRHACLIRFDLVDEDEFELTLDNVPIDDEMLDLISELRASSESVNGRPRIALRLTVADADIVQKIGRAIGRITRRGQDYQNPNWKWVCRRTSQSLRRLAALLNEFRRLPGASWDEEDLFELLAK